MQLAIALVGSARGDDGIVLARKPSGTGARW